MNIILQKDQAYCIKRKLGKGSFGCVYLVQDLKTNKEYACKIVSKSELGRNQSMIRQEIEIQTSLNHKNIVKVFNSFEDTNNIYIIQEYCKNGQLQSPTQPYTDKQLIQFITQILSALDCLHQKQLIHRDIKLDNILVHEDGTYKLTDFGWASYTINVQPVLCGTTEYMPPEAVLCQYHDQSLDCWSLGVVLYILTHCHKPFIAKTQKELIQMIVEQETIIDSSLNEDLQILLQALLTKSPQYRPTIQQLYHSRWIKQQMRIHNIFNHYEHDKLKRKFKNICKEITPVESGSIYAKTTTISQVSVSTQFSDDQEKQKI